jgi:hypothetical protein
MTRGFLAGPGTHLRRIGYLAISAVIALVATGPAAGSRAVALSDASAGGGSRYSMELTALGSSTATYLRIEIRPRAGGHKPTRLEVVTIRTRSPHRAESSLTILRNISVSDGVADIEVRPLPARTRVVVDVHASSGTPRRPFALEADASVRLLPDIVVASVSAPAQTLTTRPVDVVAEVAERNGDMGAEATVSLRWGPSLLASQRVAVAARERVAVTFSGIALPDDGLVELTVDVGDVTPTEFDATNETGTTSVDVSRHELVPSWLVVPSLGGYGAQLNQHLYAAITPAPPGSLPDLETKVKALEPQLVRVFFNDQQEVTPDAMTSFVETVELAQESGAAINITYQTAARAKLDPAVSMDRFAAVLDDLVRARGLTNVHWVTIQNEPNTTAVTLAQYEALYRALDDRLDALGLGDRIGLMGGDLVESGTGGDHRVWFDYMATHMNDVLDAYSVHIYWNYWDIPRMEFRLRDVRKIVTEELPVEARKPTFITEFGVRGLQDLPDKPSIAPWYWADGTPMGRTNIAAFQQLWFNLESAQLGFAGTAKWDAYWGKYDSGSQAWWMIGPPEEGWPLFPAYYAMQLLLQTTERGWQVLGVAPWADDDWKLNDLGQPFDQPEQEITAYRGPSGELTLIGLDTHARDLNLASTDPPGSYSIGGLPPTTPFTLAVWNSTGDGTNSIVGTVTSSAAGVARFTVPPHAAFALTTLPVS